MRYSTPNTRAYFPEKLLLNFYLLKHFRMLIKHNSQKKIDASEIFKSVFFKDFSIWVKL